MTITTAPVKAPKPLRSGFCGRGMPDWSHARCTGHVGNHPCPCLCHDVVEAEIADSPVRVDVEVGSDEWLKVRRLGIDGAGAVTASEVAGLLGIAPDNWTSPFNLYWSKKLGIGDDRDNKAMQWGHRLEQVVLERFAEEHPELDVRGGGLYYWSGRRWQMATPDGLAYESSHSSDWQPIAVVQAKCAATKEHWGEPGTDDIPAYYIAQVRWEMDVMGVPVAYVPVLFGGSDYREYVVEQNSQDVELMRAEALAFLDRLARDDPPEVDWRAATLRTLKALHPEVDDTDAEVDETWVQVYRDARAAIKTAEKAKREAEAHLRDQMGRARVATVDGVKVASRSVSDIPERTQIVRAHTQNRLYVNQHKENTDHE